MILQNVNQYMKKSIHHYKEASSFNSQYAKNNLGIIFKKGILNKISPEIGYAIEYLKELKVHFCQMQMFTKLMENQ